MCWSRRLWCTRYMLVATTRRVRVRLRSADGLPGDHVAEDEPASEQDIRPLAAQDRGLPLRRHAPAELVESGRPADAPSADGLGPDPDLSFSRSWGRLGRTRCALRCLPSFAPDGLRPAGWLLVRSPAFCPGGGRDPLHEAQGGGGAGSHPCTSMLAAALNLGTGTAPKPPVPSDEHILAPAIVRFLVRELVADACFWPSYAGRRRRLASQSTCAATPSLTPRGSRRRDIPDAVLPAVLAGQGTSGLLCIPGSQGGSTGAGAARMP
jgi:hypothetical protein